MSAAYSNVIPLRVRPSVFEQRHRAEKVRALVDVLDAEFDRLGVVPLLDPYRSHAVVAAMPEVVWLETIRRAGLKSASKETRAEVVRRYFELRHQQDGEN